MKILTFEGGFDKNFTYIFFDDKSTDAAIVDAAVPVRDLMPVVEAESISPTHLLVTHSHGDHTAYLSDYQRTFPDMTVCIFGASGRWTNQQSLADGDELTMTGLTVSVIHTPGHYPDSVCYLVKGSLFTGDTLFVGRTGRTIGMGSDTRQLFRSVYTKILTLPDNTTIYPGHNYGGAANVTLTKNREISPLLQATSEDDFVERMAQYERSR
ncbi:MAG: hydroxyacylglutathione hydrolase family protein [Candidatus Marinimicrobia bacterium]|nr:hydroxyacylglutathione hydrolase family protein [Candidatus Neomarinimicrobiota bacterium]MDP6836628.1 hydroxyacylglutathione hydrolase family protein [Candidatus Neomarinimicrobiota bacterium]